MPKLGDPIQLNLQLFDGNTGKYVRAYVRDADGVALAGSPVSVSHVGEGLYSNDSLEMPDTPEVTAVFKVFDDAGFTTPSTIHSDCLDIFPLVSEASSSSVSQIPDVVGIVTSSPTIQGIITNQNLIAKVLEC